MYYTYQWILKQRRSFLKRDIKSYLAFPVSPDVPFQTHSSGWSDWLSDKLYTVQTWEFQEIHANSTCPVSSILLLFHWASSGFRSNKFLALTHHTYTCLHVLLPIGRHLKWMTRRSCDGLQWISGSWMAGRMFPSPIWSEQFSWPSLCPWQSISITWWSHQLLHWPQSYHRGT